MLQVCARKVQGSGFWDLVLGCLDFGIIEPRARFPGALGTLSPFQNREAGDSINVRTIIGVIGFRVWGDTRSLDCSIGVILG